MTLSNVGEGAGVGHNMYTSSADVKMQPLQVSQVSVSPDGSMARSVSPQSQSLSLEPGQHNQGAHGLVAHHHYHEQRSQAPPQFQHQLAGPQYGMPATAAPYASSVPPYQQSPYQWSAAMVPQGQPSPTGPAMAVDYYSPVPAHAGIGGFVPMENGNLPYQAQMGGLPCPTPPEAVANWGPATRQNGRRQRKDAVRVARAGEANAALSSGPQQALPGAAGLAAVDQGAGWTGSQGARNGTDVSPSAVVRLRFGGYTRTGQACDRCKVRKIKCDTIPRGCGSCKSAHEECVVTDRVSCRTFRRSYVMEIENQNEDLRRLVVQYQQLLRLSGMLVQHPSQALRPIDPMESGTPPPPDPIPDADWFRFGDLWVPANSGFEDVEVDEPPSRSPRSGDNAAPDADQNGNAA